MGKLNDIRQKLLNGSTPKELIDQGYAKTSVYKEAKKISAAKSNISGSSVPDEIQELRHQKEVVKLRKEIAELEDSKEKVPDRLDKLEAEVLRLKKAIPDLAWNSYASLYGVILRNQGCSEDAARQEATRFTDEFLKHYGY